MNDGQGLTVGQLIEELSQFDPYLHVWTEGCDCNNPAGPPYTDADGSVMIRNARLRRRD
jgi:hypothetical protein